MKIFWIWRNPQWPENIKKWKNRSTNKNEQLLKIQHYIKVRLLHDRQIEHGKYWATPRNWGRPAVLDLYLINIPKHIKLQYIKVIILVSFKIFNRENPMNRINQLSTSTMLKSHLKFKSPKIKEIINKHINTCIC